MLMLIYRKAMAVRGGISVLMITVRCVELTGEYCSLTYSTLGTGLLTFREDGHGEGARLPSWFVYVYVFDLLKMSVHFGWLPQTLLRIEEMRKFSGGDSGAAGIPGGDFSVALSTFHKR
eukprot:3899440-Pleurochrysis_carterae.AAC.1